MSARKRGEAMIRVRIRQSQAQRRALATVLLMQRAYLRASGPARKEIGKLMDIVAREAHKIDAFTVYVHVNARAPKGPRYLS